MSNQLNYNLETNASNTQLDSRKEIENMYTSTPLPLDHLMCNFGMYLRSSALVKYLVLNDLYERIINIPGVIMEFGTWWGQNLILFENLRSIYEPFNKTRHIIGFDTFDGYKNFSEHDIQNDIFSDGAFSVTKDYKKYLEQLLVTHEKSNVLGHINGKHKLIEGDVTLTAPQYFKDNPSTVVALSYFDMGLYKPTKSALEAILPHIVPGSVILLDEFTWSDSPGEAIAFKEVFKNIKYKIEQSKYTAERAIITII